MSDEEQLEPWSEETERSYAAIGDRAGARVYLYNKTADLYSHINTAFSVFLVMASYAIGAAGISIAFSVDCEDTSYVNLVIQLATIAVGTIEAAHRFLNFENKIALLRWSSAKSSSIFVEIQRTLACDRGMRPRPADFCARISTAESELRTYAPDIPDWVYRSYKRRFGSGAISYRALYGEALILNNTGTSAIPRPKKKKSPTNAEVYAMERYFISQ